MSQSNILNHNREIFNLNISYSDYWDVYLHLNQASSNIDVNECLGAYIDTTQDECLQDNELISLDEYQWDKATNNGIILNNIGLTGIDNGLITYDKNNITDDEFLKILQESSLVIDDSDYRLHLNKVNGNNNIYSYNTLQTQDNNENVIKLNGGWYQGFFHINDGCDYKVLPKSLTNSGWELQFKLKPEDNKLQLLKPTLNDVYPENKGIFFYIGVRAENKWYKYYNDTNLTTELTTDDELQINSNVNKITTDNKFIFYNRTVNGITTKTKNPPESFEVIIPKYKLSDHVNYFTIMNRGKNGYTTQTIHQHENYNINKKYNIVKDLINNALAFQIKEDGSVGYKYLVKDCDNENQYSIANEWSYPNLIKKGEWVTIDVRIKPIENTTMRLMFYINGKLVLYSKELPILNLRQLDDDYNKQEGVPYNISIGGGTQGLCDVVYDNKDELPQDILFLEKEFGGSFIGLFKSFKFFTCDKNYNQINENLK